MKKFTCFFMFVVVAAFAFTNSAEAQRGRRADPNKERKESRGSGDVRYISMHRMAGCGLGSLAFDKDDKFSQVASAFLNATGMQTFAISFGTSNCTYDGVATAEKEREMFIEANIKDIHRELAVGKGEYLSALAKLYGCEGSQQVRFVLEMQNAAKSVGANSNVGQIQSMASQYSCGNT